MPNYYKNWKFSEVIKVLKKHGFASKKSTRGSHLKYTNSQTKKIVIVPYHGRSGTIAPGTLKSIVRQSGISEATWINKK